MLPLCGEIKITIALASGDLRSSELISEWGRGMSLYSYPGSLLATARQLGLLRFGAGFKRKERKSTTLQPYIGQTDTQQLDNISIEPAAITHVPTTSTLTSHLHHLTPPSSSSSSLVHLVSAAACITGEPSHLHAQQYTAATIDSRHGASQFTESNTIYRIIIIL